MYISGVQIIGGILAILSGVILVLFFAKLDELISRRYLEIYEVQLVNIVNSYQGVVLG